jgi:hypothetical protein
MNRKVAPRRRSQLAGSAGRHVRINAAARLVMRRKDIDGVIMVQAGWLMLRILRAEFDFNHARLFASEKLFELGFGEDCYAEGFGFVELGAGVFAYYDVGGFFAYGAAGSAAVGDYLGFGFFAAAFG